MPVSDGGMEGDGGRGGHDLTLSSQACAAGGEHRAAGERAHGAPAAPITWNMGRLARASMAPGPAIANFLVSADPDQPSGRRICTNCPWLIELHTIDKVQPARKLSMRTPQPACAPVKHPPSPEPPIRAAPAGSPRNAWVCLRFCWAARLRADCWHYHWAVKDRRRRLRRKWHTGDRAARSIAGARRLVSGPAAGADPDGGDLSTGSRPVRPLAAGPGKRRPAGPATARGAAAAALGRQREVAGGFPQVLSALDANLSWTEELGDAFIAQPEQLMDRVQQLRARTRPRGRWSRRRSKWYAASARGH